jgi:hypothetical protein
LKSEGAIALTKQFALHWPRNQENLDELEDLAGHKSGIYVLHQGAMPVYIGRGAISARLCSRGKEGSRKEPVLGAVFVLRDRENSIAARVGIIVAGGAAVYIPSLNKPGGKLGKKLRVAAPSRELNDFAPPRLAPVGRKRAC